MADAITLFEKFENKLEEHHGNLQRAAVELAKDWRQDRILRKLEALMIVMDSSGMLLISGGGEIIEPDDDVLAIGSGGNFALAVRPCFQTPWLWHGSKGHGTGSARGCFGNMCVYEQSDYRGRTVNRL